MVMTQATDVRKRWSSVCDSVVRSKPVFIKRTRDKMCLSSNDTLLTILDICTFSAEKFIEDDGTVTLSLNEIDLVENGSDENKARLNMGQAILEYANDYYESYDLYSRAPDRSTHIPYIFKALLIDDAEKIGDSILCQDGRN